jgi:hypothetical protein
LFRLNPVLILCSFLFALPHLVSGSSIAEQNGRFLAIELTDADADYLTQENIDRAFSLGINVIVTDDGAHVENLDVSGFLLILSATELFPTPHLLIKNRASITEDITRRYRQLQDRYPGRISAVELYRDPFERSDRFGAAASQLADTLSTLLETPLFYTARMKGRQTLPLPAGFSFRGLNVSPNSHAEHHATPFTRFIPKQDDLRESLIKLRELLTADPGYENSVLVLPANWLFRLMDERPAIATALEAYTSGETVTLPLPAAAEVPPSINWSVLFLFLLWISFVIHFRFQPMYVQSLPRYFLNHIFYVIDVMEHRIRNSMPGIIVLVQHALLTGLFLFVSAEILVSETGLRALSHHFPLLFIPGSELLSLFFVGVVLSLLMQFLSVLWIQLLNRQLQFFSQTLNLYSWPLHINLIVVTLLVVFNQSGMADALIAGFCILFALTWFMSFNVAAIDAARFLEKGKVLNIFLTVGLHTLIVIVLIWYLLTNPAFIEPVRLALALP